MIEQYLQVAIEFIKEVWFQLNTMFGLEETRAFKFLKPYLLQVQDNPAYMAIAIALIGLLPYSVYKVISISRKREKKFNELMDEMEDEEEEIDINDPRRLRRSDADNEEKPVIKEDKNKDEKKEDQLSPVKEEKPSPPFMQVLEKMDDEESEDELHLDTQKIMGTEEAEFELETTNSVLEEQKTNEEFDVFEEFDANSDSEDNITTNDEQATNKDITHDENDDLINRLKYFQENLESRLQEEETQDPDMEAIDNDSAKIPDFVEQEKFIPKALKVSPIDKKKYMEVLESFIFLKDQKKH
tara:strand:- start:116 stop:1012 length:897 start_codon:yes stop_codon:yes gene_type:complete